MKVVMVSHYYPPHIGGIEVVAQAHASSSAARGDTVVVLTSRTGAEKAITQTPGLTVIRSPVINLLEERLGIPFPVFGVRFLLAALAALRRCDVVHLHDVFYVSSHVAGLLAILLRKPLVITQHVGIVDHPSRLVVAAQRLVYATLGRLLFRRARAVVAYNGNVAHLVRRYAAHTPVHEVRNGIDVQAFSPCTPEEKLRLREEFGLPTNRPIALYVGRLTPKKGFDLLYDARCPDFLSLFVGDGLVPDGIAEDDDARFVGAVDRTTLVKYYRLSDIYVLPTSGELFTLTMQEAMACGLPVVTTDDPGYAAYEFDRLAIRLVDRDSAALSHAVMSVLEDEVGRLSAARYVRDFTIREFDWDSNISRQLALYD